MGWARHGHPLPFFHSGAPPPVGFPPHPRGVAEGPGCSAAATCQRRVVWGRKEEGDSARARSGVVGRMGAEPHRSGGPSPPNPPPALLRSPLVTARDAISTACSDS